MSEASYDAEYFAKISDESSVQNNTKYFNEVLLPILKLKSEKGEWSFYHSFLDCEKFGTTREQVFTFLRNKKFKVENYSDQRENTTNYLVSWIHMSKKFVGGEVHYTNR